MDGDRNVLARGLGRLVRDDPTLRLTHDPESGETRLHGMGQLHLDIVSEILRDRYGCVIALGPPRVAYRTRLAGSAGFTYTLSKQTGGPGMYAKLVGRVAPAETFTFRWEVVGGAVPAAYAQVIAEAMRAEAERGAGTGAPLLGVEVTITDGAMHPVDSNERAFALAAAHALRAAVADEGAERLAPVARVVLESTTGGPGALAGVLAGRGGRLVDATADGALARVEGILPFERLFGLAEAVRSATAGAGTFSAEPEGYEPARA